MKPPPVGQMRMKKVKGLKPDDGHLKERPGHLPEPSLLLAYIVGFGFLHGHEVQHLSEAHHKQPHNIGSDAANEG
jgi:hypothetical protein